MHKLYNFIDRITPKNYWLQLLTLTFLTLFISISFNIIISDFFDIYIDENSSPALKFFKTIIFILK